MTLVTRLIEPVRIAPAAARPGGVRSRVGWTFVLLTAVAIVAFSAAPYFTASLSELADRGVGLAPTYAGIGFGRMKNVPNLSLVDATTTNANTANAMLGLRYYLTDRVTLRIDWSLYTAFIGDNRSSEFRAWTAGLSFFF